MEINFNVIRSRPYIITQPTAFLFLLGSVGKKKKIEKETRGKKDQSCLADGKIPPTQLDIFFNTNVILLMRNFSFILQDILIF